MLKEESCGCVYQHGDRLKTCMLHRLPGPHDPGRERMAVENVKLKEALAEAVAIVEGHPDRSPFVAVEDWKKLL